MKPSGLSSMDGQFLGDGDVTFEIKCGHAAKRVVEAPEGAERVEVVASGSVLLVDRRVEVEDAAAPHDIEASGHRVALLRPLVGKGRYVYPSRLHIELEHEFLHILVEVIHALFCLGVRE